VEEEEVEVEEAEMGRSKWRHGCMWRALPLIFHIFSHTYIHTHTHTHTHKSNNAFLFKGY
jgi:hypothetical protein